MNKKNEFRKKSKENLKNASKGRGYRSEKLFVKNLLTFIKCMRAKNILIYLPMQIEPNVFPVIKRLRTLKKSLYVPFIEDINFKIVKYRLPVKIGAYGIFSCTNSYAFIKKIDLAIVPAIGIDPGFKRVGFGKGMYDRFFASLRRKPLVAFVQKTLNFSSEEICEAHDLVGDYLILPNKIFAKGRKNNAYNNINGYGSRRLVRAGGIFGSKKTGFRKISNIHRAVKVKS